MLCLRLCFGIWGTRVPRQCLRHSWAWQCWVKFSRIASSQVPCDARSHLQWRVSKTCCIVMICVIFFCLILYYEREILNNWILIQYKLLWKMWWCGGDFAMCAPCTICLLILLLLPKPKTNEDWPFFPTHPHDSSIPLLVGSNVKDPFN